MLKYVNTQVVFSEIPDEITLAINISGCQNNCDGCHSSYLKENIGIPLTIDLLYKLIDKNKGITTVCFMGGDSNPGVINDLAFFITLRSDFPYKIGWYSGKKRIHKDIDLDNFDFIKLGPYIKERGPLNDPNTNQRMYEIVHKDFKNRLKDITYKFWK